ncbi:T9SS type A sorting domain-containing protein [Gramella sp. MAR_2010_147]|uniref:T9SS type A sorting domain-containing protein n=1 Tax=Gramella sp. MAR_2010_147 TaxID=1250205 RepID=UPI00087BC2A8|nr:T9SS type A sorting domain-containing protein [Gramella sp. MAR_2010_147]SDR72706.1 Por secretion system C-terminal sorting domain-containing protein [Gramella sp. MAR_2010_147]
MRLPFFFLVFFSTSTIYAQLYISPSDKSDSYLYAKDRLVFVRNNIHLNKNHNKDTEASFYLRKGAQLLQGEKLKNLNTGDGSISVFQRGTSNAFDYNYWGLPVIVYPAKQLLPDYLNDPLTNTESRKVIFTSALEGQSDPLSIANRWIYTYSGTDYSSWQYLGDHFDLLPGEGFTMKGVNGSNYNKVEGEMVNPGSAQIYDFRGTPNDAKIELPIEKEQVLLLGNPYPSALDLDKFLFENTSTTGIAYFWDSKKNGNSHYLADYEGGYGTYSPGTGIYIPAIFKRYGDGTITGEIGQIYPRKIIPIAQGFMVIGKNNGKIHFQNSQRLYQKEALGVSTFKSPEITNSSLILSIELDSTYIQELGLAFLENSTINEDHALDARKMNESPQEVSWVISEEKFVVNARPKIDKELIPLKISLSKTSILKFYVSEFNNFNPDRLFVYDAKDDLYYGIKTGSLKISLPEGDYNDRFFISFIEKLASEENIKEEPVAGDSKPPLVLLNTIDIFQNNLIEQLEIKILYDTHLSNLKIYDLNGKLFLNQNFRSKEKEFYFPTGNLSNAVYIVKVKTTDNKELTKKIGIKN